MLTLITIVFLLGIAWWSTHHEKKQLAASGTIEADAALHTVRRIATRRAAQASIPIPMSMQFETTPIHGTVAPVAPNGRAPTSQPYAQHNRKNNLKIVKR